MGISIRFCCSHCHLKQAVSDFRTATEACKGALRVVAMGWLCLGYCRVWELREQGHSQVLPVRSRFWEGCYKQKLCVWEAYPRGQETAGITDAKGL